MGSFLSSRSLLPNLLQGDPEHVIDYILNFNWIVKLQLKIFCAKPLRYRILYSGYGVSDLVTPFKTIISDRVLVRTGSIGL